MTVSKHLLILGGGPAGLSRAYEFMRHGRRSLVWDKNDAIGGLCRTIAYKGYRFDIGPHRFYTKNDEVDKLWHDILAPDVVRVKRLTRIYYKNKFFEYPIKPLNALRGLGLYTSFKAGLSYLAAQWRPSGTPARNFEDWIIRKFGKVLYRIFFKTYTEKVWGLPCTEIGSEWAAQRIKGLSLPSAIRTALFGQRRGKKQIKTLIDAFDYPRTGAGLVYEKMSELIRAGGSTIMTDTAATRFLRQGSRVVRAWGGDEPSQNVEVEHLFSSIPLTEFILKLDPPPPDEVLKAARALYYRDHITVNLILNRPSAFPDNWIYVHSPEVKIARIADYGNFSKDMLANERGTCVSVEYFAFADEDLWKMDDAALIQFASEELDKLGLIRPNEIDDGFVVREKDSYPVYYVGHEPEFEKIRKYVDTFDNVTLIGRGGMFKYNNQDHSILTGLLAARNYLGADHNLWDVNTEQEYLEEKKLRQ